MKVLHIIAAYKPALIYGGPTMSAAMLCEELTKAGVEIHVYATTANGRKELNVDSSRSQIVDGVKVNYFKRLTKDHTHFSPAMCLSLWRYAKGFDLVHIHAWWNLVSLFSALIALLRGIPVLISPRGTLSPYSFTNRHTTPKRLIHTLLGKRLLSHSHIHSTSARETAAIKELFVPMSLTVLPNFVNLGPLPLSRKNKSHPMIKLIFLSRIEEKKGLDILLMALEQVTEPFHLTIAGDGDAVYIQHLKRLSAGVAEKITWTGFAGQEKFDLLQIHDLLVLPSHDENFGNVVIESLSTGTAVLISENVGLASYIQENNLGWVCHTSAQSVAEAINHIAAKSVQLQNIAKTAPFLVRHHFTGNALIQQYISLYQKISGL